MPVKIPHYPKPLGFKIDFALERIFNALQYLGNPHHNLPPVIHIAGTNGKGSTLSFLRSIFEAAGKKVHCYISPHLVWFNERITLAGVPIKDAELYNIYEELRQTIEGKEDAKLTYFEAVTTGALLAFSRHKADFLLLETGMGGRLDATNVIAKPLASIITNIDFDHQEFLGGCVQAIAREKAGVIKPGRPLIIAKQKHSKATEVLKEYATSQACPYIMAQNLPECFRPPLLKLGLAGRHQYDNAATAVSVIEYLNKHENYHFTTADIAKGLANAKWAGRMQDVTAEIENYLKKNWHLKISLNGRKIILDGGHNINAAEAISDYIKEQGKAPCDIIFAMHKGKDIEGYLAMLKPYINNLYAIHLEENENFYSPTEIAEICQKLQINVKKSQFFTDALQSCLQDDKGDEDGNPDIFILGSLYLCGELLGKIAE